MKTISYQQLIDLKACQVSRSRFYAVFGDAPVALTVANLRKLAGSITFSNEVKNTRHGWFEVRDDLDWLIKRSGVMDEFCETVWAAQKRFSHTSASADAADLIQYCREVLPLIRKVLP